MKRMITTTLAATAMFGLTAFGLTACKGGGGAAGAKLIPEQATIMGGVDVAGLMKTSLYTKNKDKLVKGEQQEMMDAAKGCNIDPEKINSVVIGADGKENFAAVINAAGIGVEANLNCIADKIKEKTGEDAPFSIEGKEIKMKGDEGAGFIVDDATIAIASKGWSSAVKDLTEGKGKSAMDGANKDIFGKADKGKTIWFAGKAPAGMLPPQAEGLESGAGSIDLSSGLGIKVTATFNDAAKATALQDMAKGGLAAGKEMAKAQGVPEGVIDGVKIEAKDKDLNVELTVSQADLDTLNDKLGALAGAM